uniref:Methyltransferase type 11 domain-containing protein n=1 Tax=Odontella aurita TaxID=265563 RepID=A0A7S4MB71_9STRA|mmetsp:Transcript_16484/g.47400  ORF Transcript_16484/g.47400 Transcript_16484/m.47400 type:complete len:424 (+) Transcript_16484:196-1467(+)
MVGHFVIFVCLLLGSATGVVDAFQPPTDDSRVLASGRTPHRPRLSSVRASATPADVDAQPRASPRTGPAQMLLNAALSSPLWKYLLVPQARANIVKTAEANGIQWNRALAWIREQDGPWKEGGGVPEGLKESYPSYYTKPFHAYEEGNLSWDAAFEQELAGRAVGARNFPSFGEAGEEAFRSAFDVALDSLGADVPRGGIVVDLGCGTGTSTRRIARRYPTASRVMGIDMSPYFVEVGKRLLELSPRGAGEGGQWVTTIEPDDRIELCVGDATSTGLPDGCVDVCVVGLVVHELPPEVSIEVCAEAKRLLKPGGQLWIYEMDFDSPAFASQRSNALLFSLIRSTEPYLDEYADGCALVREHLMETFEDVKLTAATGRHYALVATKGDKKSEVGKRPIEDTRFNDDGTYAVNDTHLKTWESKED